MTSQFGKKAGMDFLAIPQIYRLDSVPLKESEITMHFFIGIFLFFFWPPGPVSVYRRLLKPTLTVSNFS